MSANIEILITIVHMKNINAPVKKVARLIGKYEAIDFTPIFEFVVTENLKKGDTIEFDKGNKFITKESKK